ncbi:hypothetical protein PPGU19_005490 [Paraburkholderia sp. PGU19]|uniref:hypothetical protein n=1 Tax=Paraburkholderia sp. PGU19 TaxID=2735434 RepID=UPI0015DA3DC2|nr:hypothetical protein [Paraburkholderia sp. PGU19]BCF95980.1 hypothetical protein PPGU19_005490 [Paraburkholderia sp. PGU19]
MKKAKVIAISAVTLFGLSGCGSKQDANKSNFQSAIQDYFNTKSGVCVMVPAKEIPFTLQKSGGMNFINEPEKAAALVSAGLLSAKDTEVKAPFGNKMVAGVQYSLTDEGKKYLVKGAAGNMGNWDAFCGGKYKVKEVENFTQPADMFGTKISQVNFIYEVDDVPAWAKQPALQAAYPSVQHDLSDAPGDKAVLVATSDGWMHERLFKSKGG